MYKKSSSTKEKIMLLTAKLLNEKDAEQISRADIAKEAGVAVGLMNYHFQTKENLFSSAIEFYITQTISEDSKIIISNGSTAKERLTASLKGFGDFLANNSRMCRLYFISILEQAGNSAVSQMGYKHYIPILREIYPEKSDTDLVFGIYPAICTIQMMFMNSEPFTAATGMDFFSREQRYEIIEKLVSGILKNDEKEPAL